MKYSFLFAFFVWLFCWSVSYGNQGFGISNEVSFVGDSTGISILRLPQKENSPTINVFPNPGNKSLNFDFVLGKKGQPFTVKVFSPRGRVVKIFEGKGSGKKSLHWSRYQERKAFGGSGIYIVRLTTPKQIQSTKFLVLR